MNYPPLSAFNYGWDTLRFGGLGLFCDFVLWDYLGSHDFVFVSFSVSGFCWLWKSAASGVVMKVLPYAEPSMGDRSRYRSKQSIPLVAAFIRDIGLSFDECGSGVAAKIATDAVPVPAFAIR